MLYFLEIYYLFFYSLNLFDIILERNILNSDATNVSERSRPFMSMNPTLTNNWDHSDAIDASKLSIPLLEINLPQNTSLPRESGYDWDDFGIVFFQKFGIVFFQKKKLSLGICDLGTSLGNRDIGHRTVPVRPIHLVLEK